MIELYYVKMSPPVRAVRMTAKAVGVELDLKLLNLFKGEHLAPEYIEMNPMHTVPTLNDNGFVVFDSHAICGYLVNQYGKDDSLYPRDAKKRAIVDQRLHFDSGTLFPCIRAITFPLFVYGEKNIPADKIDAVKEAFEFLDSLIGANPWVAGDKMTIADMCCVASVSSLIVFVPEIREYPNMAAWFQRCQQQIPGYDINQDGLNQFQMVIKSKMT